MPRKKVEEPTEKLYLEQSELARIELNHKSEEARKLEKKVGELELSLKIAQLEIVRKDVELLRMKNERLDVKHNQDRLGYKQFYEELKKKYKLKDGFGFNPETGELKP